MFILMFRTGWLCLLQMSICHMVERYLITLAFHLLRFVLLILRVFFSFVLYYSFWYIYILNVYYILFFVRLVDDIVKLLTRMKFEGSYFYPYLLFFNGPKSGQSGLLSSSIVRLHSFLSLLAVWSLKSICDLSCKYSFTS